MAGPQDIKDHGWRQGSVLPAELASRLATPRFTAWGPDDRAVLLSQDCDVVHAMGADLEFAMSGLRGKQRDPQGVP